MNFSENYDAKKTIVSVFIIFFLSLVYLYGVIAIVRVNILFEVFISLLFPIMCIGFKVDQNFLPRVKQLFYIESIYNILVILTLVLVLSGMSSLYIALSWGFVVFFVIQIIGFIVIQKKRKSYLGILQSLMGICLMFIWFFHKENTISTIDNQGRFLMWGEDAPLSIQIVYTLWFLNVIFLESVLLPKLSQAIVQSSSLLLCWCSGEFFHARLLTACHLFMLDGLFGYSKHGWLGSKFCSIPESYYEKFSRLRPLLKIIMFCGVLATFVLSFFYGLDLKGILA
ncbi:hypothetical protein [Candidatus Uabimicrobium sp. HlEnr_7]|uniref:hypothetical protein n=1 Tax=Candidatus Uabimicrobium helgolandensis TaxID=3095367 RepID=UPI0035561A71